MTEDVTLEALYEAETAEHTAKLRAGFERLAEPDLPSDFVAELVIAAHNLRGAARILGVGPAERLAGALEGALQAVRDGQLRVGVAGVDVMRAALTTFQATNVLVDGSPAAPELAARIEDAVGRLAGLRTPTTRHTAPPPPPAVQDEALLEVFRQEAETQSRMLGQGILALESDAGQPELLSALMRAAHSLKGASRMVRLTPAVDLAHYMEDLITAARDGRVELTTGAIDALLGGSDAFAELARIGADAESFHGLAEQFEAATRAVRAALDGQAPARPPAAQPPQAPAAVAAPTLSAAPAPAQTARAIDLQPEPVVRVTATALNQLVSLVSELGTEVQRLEPLSSELQRLSVNQGELIDLVEEVARALASSGAPLLPALRDLREQARWLRERMVYRAEHLDEVARRSERLAFRLRRQALSTRMRPFGDCLHGFPRLVRDVANKLGKQVALEVVGEQVLVDREVLSQLSAPLSHILRNAIDHGIEAPEVRTRAGKPAAGRIEIRARHVAGILLVSVQDDGRGIDLAVVRRRIVSAGLATAEEAAELSDLAALDYLFAPGFSTTHEVSEISGRGVGLDVVRRDLQNVGGTARIHSVPGRGTTLDLSLPVTLSTLRAVAVEIGGQPYAFPLKRLEHLARVPMAEVEVVGNRQFFLLEGASVSLVRAQEVLELEGAVPASPELCVVLLRDRTGPLGLVVDQLLGEHELVVSPLDPRLGRVQDVAATSIMPDGRAVLIFDVDELLETALDALHRGPRQRVESGAGAARKRRKRVLVVDDTMTVRELERQLLRAQGYDVTVAVDGLDAWHTLQSGAFDLVITDVDMPRMTGIELIRAMRREARTASLPAVIVSYLESEQDRLRGLEAGASYYLTKGAFEDDRLRRAVIDLIGEAE